MVFSVVWLGLAGEEREGIADIFGLTQIYLIYRRYMGINADIFRFPSFSQQIVFLHKDSVYSYSGANISKGVGLW
ncbi:hypothetical protein J2Y03_000394 [Neobacillus niacini]|nr:hypothetical protein [Neobacillus niacini]